MKAPVRFWVPEVGAAALPFVEQVLSSNYVNEGDVTDLFERRLAELLGTRFAVATTSGTIAIFLALAGLGVGRGDEVIVPDITFVATANAVMLSGAEPVLVDVDPVTLNVDVARVAAAITPRTRAIVPVHVSGRSADIGGIMGLAHQHGLVVVEDAAEALLSKHAGQWLGTFGDAGCFSFSPNKSLTTGQGGLIVTNNERLHVRLRELKDQGRSIRGTGGDDSHRSVGYNFKFTDLQAAVGLDQLFHLESRAASQKRIRRRYSEGLRKTRSIKLLPFDLEGGETPQWTDAISERRDDLIRYLTLKHIECRRFWLPLHSQPPYQKPDDLFPVSTKMCKCAFWLPSSFKLDDEQVDAICRHIVDFTTRGSGSGTMNCPL